MKGWAKRLDVLEADQPASEWGPILEALSDDQLDRLEAIVIARDAGASIEDMPDDDQRFLESIAPPEHGGRK